MRYYVSKAPSLAILLVFATFFAACGQEGDQAQTKPSKTLEATPVSNAAPEEAAEPQEKPLVDPVDIWEKGEVVGQIERRGRVVGLVVDGDRLFATLEYNAPVSVLDAATGETIATVKGTDGTAEILVSDNIGVAAVRGSDAQSGAEKLVAFDRDGSVVWQIRLGEDHGRASGYGGRTQNPVIDAGYKAFQSLWPGIGRVLVGDAESYQYLVESIDVHPSQEALKLMMEDAGFESVEYHNFLSGVAAIHRGEKP